MNKFYYFQLLSLWGIYILTCIECVVLDPALYLSPTPPLTDRADSIAPAALWSRSAQQMPGSGASSSQVLAESKKILYFTLNLQNLHAVRRLKVVFYFLLKNIQTVYVLYTTF